MQIRPAFGGNIIATIVNTWEDPQMVTVREGVMKITVPDTNRKGKTIKITPELSPETKVMKVLERVRQPKTVDLKKASIIVSGGYGRRKQGKFQTCRTTS